MTDEEFLARLQELCMRFDNHVWTYPKHQFEGYAVWAWITHYLKTGRAFHPSHMLGWPPKGWSGCLKEIDEPSDTRVYEPYASLPGIAADADIAADAEDT